MQSWCAESFRLYSIVSGLHSRFADVVLFVMHSRERHSSCVRQSTDDRVAAALREAGLRVESHSGYLLHEPADVRIQMGGRWVGHFGTLTPFHRCGGHSGGPEDAFYIAQRMIHACSAVPEVST